MSQVLRTAWLGTIALGIAHLALFWPADKRATALGIWNWSEGLPWDRWVAGHHSVFEVATTSSTPQATEQSLSVAPICAAWCCSCGACLSRGGLQTVGTFTLTDKREAAHSEFRASLSSESMLRF